MRISIVMPAYNEERRIGSTLEAYSSYFETLRKSKKLEYEILVVINNTTDKTEEVVKNSQKNNKNILYLNIKQGGKGNAVREGFKDALKRKNDLIGFVDADLATPPSAYYHLISNLNGYDAIIPNRYEKGSIIKPRQTLIRVLASRVFNMIVRLLFFMPYRDTQCGAKVFKREVAQMLTRHMGMTKWAFDVEMLYETKKRGYSIAQETTEWRDIGGSKIQLGKSSSQMLLSIIRLRIVKSPFKKILKPIAPIIGYIWRKLL